jgi:hypothetical protein
MKARAHASHAHVYILLSNVIIKQFYKFNLFLHTEKRGNAAPADAYVDVNVNYDHVRVYSDVQLP